MRLLIYPPFADPTQPYISLPILKGYLRERKENARVIDLNLEAAQYLLGKKYLEYLIDKLDKRFLALNKQSPINFLEQWEYSLLAQARNLIKPLWELNGSILEIFQNKDLFYNYAFYSWGRQRVDDFFQILSAVYFPYQYNFNQASHIVVPWNLDMLESYSRGQNSPLDIFYRQYFADHLAMDNIDLVGISLTFVSQIPEAFYLCRLIRELYPQCFILLGGTCIHQIAANPDNKSVPKLFDYVDGICLFEGEELLVRLFPLLGQWQAMGNQQSRFDLIKDIPNIFLLHPERRELHRGPLHIQDLTNPPLPDYSDLDLDRYLAPGRIVLYAPTRGCYWSKCSFCYYGFSQTAGHGYREVPAAEAAKQMGKLSKKYGTKNFYLSCDVLAPAYTMQLAEAILEKNLNIKWSTDLKIEKYYTAERCQKLQCAGLRAVAFGVESGCDRILQLMNKGTTTAVIEEVNRNFHGASIATAWMAFHYHPGETMDEAMQTVSWIARERDVVDLFIVGEFDLTNGSGIAGNPVAYGITQIYHMAGDEFKLYPLFLVQDKNSSVKHSEQIDAALDEVASYYSLSHYPWAGAISTHHTFLYVLRYGQRVFASNLTTKTPMSPGFLPSWLTIRSLTVKDRHSLSAISKAKDRFIKHYRKAAFHPDESMIAPISLEHFQKEALDMPYLGKPR